MGVVEQTSGAVESQLTALEESYDSFPVNQRTVTVPTAEYEQERGRSGAEVDVRAKVRNESAGVLYVDTDEGRALPATRTSLDGELEDAARTTVDEMAGVSCEIEGIEAVTILGLHDDSDEDRETVYSLVVLFEAQYTNGTLGPDAVWRESDAESGAVHP